MQNLRGTCIKSTFRLGTSGESGIDDHGYLLGGRIRLQAYRGFIPGHSRQAYIHHD